MATPELPKKLGVFLCHSSGDKPAVRGLYRRLQQDGFKPWLDEEDLLAGQDWHREISKAVRESDVVVVCLSRDSITKAGYVQKEIKLALDVADEQPEGTIFIIPLRLEECEVPERINRWHWVNLFLDNGYERLKIALQGRASELRSNIPSHSTTSEPEVTPRQHSETVNADRDRSEVKQSTGDTNVSPDWIDQTNASRTDKEKRRRRFVKGRIITALVTAAAVIILGYWQFVYKPAQSNSDEAIPYAGRVIDANTREVIRGAKVSVEAQGIPQVFHTDSEGVFYLKLSGSNDAVRIRVEADNYQVFDRNVLLSRTAIEDVHLIPTPIVTPDTKPSGTPTPRSNVKPAASRTTRQMPRPASTPCSAEDRLLGRC